MPASIGPSCSDNAGSSGRAAILNPGSRRDEPGGVQDSILAAGILGTNGSWDRGPSPHRGGGRGRVMWELRPVGRAIGQNRFLRPEIGGMLFSAERQSPGGRERPAGSYRENAAVA